MRISHSAALLLPALASAQSFQIPFSSQLSSLWDSVQGYLPSAANPYNTTSHINVGRAKEIHNLTAKTWASELGARASQPWLVLISGGNLTCGAYNSSCANVDAAWATASASARTDSRAPNLAYVNCEENRLLCATWGAHPATVWWIEPEVRVTRAADTEAARVTAREAQVEGAVPLDSLTEVSRDIYIVGLNKTTVVPADITALYRKGEYKTRGSLLSHEEMISRHPFNGKLAKSGLNVPVGYVFYVISIVPGWTTVMIISFVVRMFM